MANPVFVFDGGDGAGKTTQSLLWAKFLRDNYGLPITYISYPVYETFVGATIGRCLKRWGEENAIDLPSPETTAKLLAFNRTETSDWVKELIKEGNILFFNRGPLSNLYNVARRAILDGVDWEHLENYEKEYRINQFLRFDREFLRLLVRESAGLHHLFLALEPTQAKWLVRKRLLSTTGGEPDRYESDAYLQELTTDIYAKCCRSDLTGFEVKLIRAERGSVERHLLLDQTEVGTSWIEEHGISMTGINVGREIGPVLGINDKELGILFARETGNLMAWLRGHLEAGTEPGFEFRNLLGLPADLGLGYSESRFELLKEKFAKDRGVLETLNVSEEIEKGLRVVREREF